MFSPEKSRRAENSCKGSGFLAKVCSRASMVRILPPVEETEPALVRPIHDDVVEVPELRDFPLCWTDLFRDSQRAIESRVSWQRDCCFRTSQTGMKTVKISSIMIETAILHSIFSGSKSQYGSLSVYLPHWGDKVVVDSSHARNIESNEPHGRSVKTVLCLLGLVQGM